MRSHNWLRTDSIFIENTQIEAISNRPPWLAAVLEVGMHDSPAASAAAAAPPAGEMAAMENRIAHVLDLGANYWSLWNFHRISAASVMNNYQRFKALFDEVNRRVGYNVRPSLIWSYGGDNAGLIVGVTNDGVAGVPGVLRVSVVSDDGKVSSGGSLDPGYPLPGKIRQAQIPLPKGTKWEGLKLKAEIEVKSMRYPVRWACRQKTNPDGSLTLTRNVGGA